jgi:lysine/ornithine N-monooxygenase
MSGAPAAGTAAPAAARDAPGAGPVLIVGAGPYGISLANELHRRGVPFTLVGEPFSLWLRHVLSPARLRSDVNASEVWTHDGAWNLRRYLRRAHGRAARDIEKHRIPVEVFRGYARWILARLPFPVRRERVVALARRAEGGFEATFADGGRLAASRVVLACGIEPYRRLPACLTALPAGTVVHSYDVGEVEEARGRRLLVVGGGQSAAELVVHLARHNRGTWVHRSPRRFWAEPINLPRLAFRLLLHASALTVFVPRFLRRALGSDFVASTITPDLRPVLGVPNVRRLRADAADLHLEPEGEGVRSSVLGESYDRVVACTGYRMALERLAFLDATLQCDVRVDDRGAPHLGVDFSTSVPGLYAIGGLAEPSHGPAQRFMFGCREAARRVGRALRVRS